MKTSMSSRDTNTKLVCLRCVGALGTVSTDCRGKQYLPLDFSVHHALTLGLE